MDPHGHSKPTWRIRALGFSVPIMMHLVGVECNVSLLTNLQQYLHLPLRLQHLLLQIEIVCSRACILRVCFEWPCGSIAQLSTACKRRLLAVLTWSSEPDILFLLHARLLPFLLDVASWLARAQALEHTPRTTCYYGG